MLPAPHLVGIPPVMPVVPPVMPVQLNASIATSESTGYVRTENKLQNSENSVACMETLFPVTNSIEHVSYCYSMNFEKLSFYSYEIRQKYVISRKYCIMHFFNKRKKMFQSQQY